MFILFIGIICAIIFGFRSEFSQASEQPNYRKLSEIFESKDAFVSFLIRHRTKRYHRHTRCWRCGKELSSFTHDKCDSCGWLICSCSACSPNCSTKHMPYIPKSIYDSEESILNTYSGLNDYQRKKLLDFVIDNIPGLCDETILDSSSREKTESYIFNFLKIYKTEIYSCIGLDKSGYDENGFSTQGYNRDGYDKDGYSLEGYNRYGYDRKGYDREGYYNKAWDLSKNEIRERNKVINEQLNTNETPLKVYNKPIIENGTVQNMRIGAAVKHHKYGEGIVTKIQKDLIYVKFGEYETSFNFPNAFLQAYLKIL